MKKVMHIITGLTPGGAELTLLRLLFAMDRERYQLAVVSLMDENTVGAAVKSLGIPVYALGFRAGLPNFRGLLKFIRLLREFRPDLIHGRMYHANLLSLLGGWVAKCPVVFGIHHALDDLEGEKPLTRLMIRWNARLSRLTTRIVFISRAIAEQHDHIGFDPAKKEVISNGVDCERFFPDEAGRSRFRAELGVERETLLVGMAGRFHPIKDHDTFLRAARAISSRHPKVRFLLSGSGVDAENVELVNAIRALGLEERVRLLGYRGDMNRFFQGIDIFVSSSKSEAFGNVLAEAMASALPCVATDVGASAYVLGDAGFLVPPRNPNALAEGIERLLVLGEEKRTALGGQARNRVMGRFAFQNMVKGHEELYGRLTSQLRERTNPHPIAIARHAPGQMPYPTAPESRNEI
jgi:glycosyltransferase involved in cell wall biosynthesis